MSFNDFVTIKENDYRINFQFMTKNNAIDRNKNPETCEKRI